MDKIIYEGKSISEVWFKMVNTILENPGNKLAPAFVTLHSFDPDECEILDPVGKLLDNVLLKRGLNSINTVANTIFPLSLYKLSRFNRQRLYDIYINTLPRRRALDSRNRDGLYFERLIAFGDIEYSNQLEFIISEFTKRSGVRTSMLQAAIFDPKRDHKRVAQLGFPCLQHVSFTRTNNALSINAFYATQQLFDKAYGNILGLVRLGNFMAKEMNLPLERVNCYVGLEKLERVTKNDDVLKAIAKTAKEYLGNED